MQIKLFNIFYGYFLDLSETLTVVSADPIIITDRNERKQILWRFVDKFQYRRWETYWSGEVLSSRWGVDAAFSTTVSQLLDDSSTSRRSLLGSSSSSHRARVSWVLVLHVAEAIASLLPAQCTGVSEILGKAPSGGARCAEDDDEPVKKIH